METTTTPAPAAEIKLTQYSHGAGCGCKISPELLDQMLEQVATRQPFPGLLVGNDKRDDAAVIDLGNGMGLVSTTDFFMPIVDDPESFGRIASANAISDVYAMGGQPVLAIAILGFPIDKLPPSVAGKILEGSRQTCLEAGIPLAGGHSIDSPEPIFGLAVSGLVPLANLKRNDGAQVGDLLYLTKPLGIGVLTTAEKKGLLKPEHQGLAAAQMMQLNKVGQQLGTLPGVHALTDVTGFGLLGHLCEMAQGAGLTAELDFDQVPALPHVWDYIEQKAVPGGTHRNWKSYGEKVQLLNEDWRLLLADPQTSGGLLIAVAPDAEQQLLELLQKEAPFFRKIGKMTAAQSVAVVCR